MVDLSKAGGIRRFEKSRIKNLPESDDRHRENLEVKISNPFN
jgi:hypothetical protein